MPIPSKIVCPITGVGHSIIHTNKPNEMENLIAWGKSLLSRLNSNQHINLVIDCEGYELGVREDSLGMAQIGEVFDPGFDLFSFYKCPELSKVPQLTVSSGVLVFFPITPQAATLLSQVLSHPNVVLLTFDFTHDFATLIEAGVNLNLRNVFDAQCGDPSALNATFQSGGRLNSILWFVEQDSQFEPTAKKAADVMRAKKRDMFDLLHFIYYQEEDPFKYMVDEEFLRYAAADICMTAIAIQFAFRVSGIPLVYELTSKKVQEFREQNAKYQSILAAASVRTGVFFRQKASTILHTVCPTSLARSPDEDILYYLKLWNQLSSTLDALDICGTDIIGDTDPQLIANLFDDLTDALEKVRPRIVAMKSRFQ